MPGVVQGEDTDVVAAANFETIDPAVRCNDPWGLLRVSSYRPHQMKCQKADRTRVREDRDTPADMIPQDLPKLGRASAQEVSVTFAFGYDVMDVAADKGVVVLGERLFRLSERESRK